MTATCRHCGTSYDHPDQIAAFMTDTIDGYECYICRVEREIDAEKAAAKTHLQREEERQNQNVLDGKPIDLMKLVVASCKNEMERDKAGFARTETAPALPPHETSAPIDPREFEPNWDDGRLSCPKRTPEARGHVWQCTQAQAASLRPVWRHAEFMGHGCMGRSAPYGLGSSRPYGKYLRIRIDGVEWRLMSNGQWLPRKTQ
jgi:hypothetical protein